jgi:hypothetical protein
LGRDCFFEIVVVYEHFSRLGRNISDGRTVTPDRSSSSIINDLGIKAESFLTKAILDAILNAFLLRSDFLFAGIEANVVLGIERIVRVSTKCQ